MELVTEKYIIRNFTVDDARDLHDYLSNEAVYAYEPGSPICIVEAKRMCAERAAGNEFFAVVDRAIGVMIGHFYLGRVEPDFANTYEMGFIFNPKYQGRGRATESGKALIAEWFDSMRAHRIVANCNPENMASRKLLERLGFEKEGRLRKNIFFKEVDGKPLWLDTDIYGLINGNER